MLELRESKSKICSATSLAKLNWIIAQTAHISMLGSGPQLDCAHVRASLSSDEVSREADFGAEERRKEEHSQ